MDGHGGQEVAKYVSINFPKVHKYISPRCLYSYINSNRDQ